MVKEMNLNNALLKSIVELSDLINNRGVTVEILKRYFDFVKDVEIKAKENNTELKTSKLIKIVLCSLRDDLAKDIAEELEEVQNKKSICDSLWF